MERYEGKVAIVTGASSGIGASIAESLTKAGMKVVGLARRVENIQTRAEQLERSGAKGKLHAVQCDLLNEEEILKAFDWTTQNVGNVQVLINNAGTSYQNNFMDGTLEEWRRVFDTNVLALCVTMKAAVQIMRDNKIEGHIININSIAGQYQMYMPGIGVYGASKHAVTNLTEVLRREMVDAKTNIKVSSISPGLVLTEMITSKVISEEAKEQLAALDILESQDVADAVLYILGVPRRVQINELTIRPINSTM